VNPEAWIVLVVGVATVVSQVWAALRLDAVARRQLQASEASLRSELQAVIVVAQGMYSTASGTVRVTNGGRYPAIDFRVDCLDEHGQGVGGTGRAPMVEPVTEREVTIPLGSDEARDAFGRCDKIRARWSDGSGAREETLTLLRPQ